MPRPPQNYEDSLTSGFRIRRADGDAIVDDMAKELSDVFKKNKVALEVSVFINRNRFATQWAAAQ